MASLIILALCIAGFSLVVLMLEAGFRCLRFLIAAAELLREPRAFAPQPTTHSFTIQEARVR